MRETIWSDVAWLWGSSLAGHALFVAGLVVIIGAIRQGWLEADNASRINRRLRASEKNPHSNRRDSRGEM